MRIPRIYTPQPLETGETIQLDDNAFNHSVRVLRLKSGAHIVLFNGEGGEYKATLSGVQRRQASAAVGEFTNKEVEPPLQLIMGQCISRGEKMDYTVQKSVELGVTEIVPLFSERCGVQLKGERLEKKRQHWQSVSVSACEQSGRNRIPTIEREMTLAAWIENVEADIKLVLDPSESTTLNQLQPPQNSVALLLGPEGGMTEEEVAHAKRHGFLRIRLGPRVLRTDTASLATLSAIQLAWGDFGAL